MNAIQQKQVELSRLENGSVEYLALQSELAKFYQKVAQVLEEKFYPENYRSVYAILESIPCGNLESVFGQWLTELCLLGCLRWPTVDYYKSEYHNPAIPGRWKSGL